MKPSDVITPVNDMTTEEKIEFYKRQHHVFRTGRPPIPEKPSDGGIKRKARPSAKKTVNNSIDDL